MLVLDRSHVRHLGRQGRLLTERVLVTGALGCVGAWCLKAVLAGGDEPVGYDLGDRTHRLDLVLSSEERADVTLVQGDVTDLDALGRALDSHAVTRVVHLAALQVPFCRADPVLGARVNVVGTVNVFEAVKQRLDRIPGVAYASSAAVYSAADPSPAPETGGTRAGDALRCLQACERGHGAGLLGGELGAVDRDQALRRLRAGPGPGHDVRPDRGDAGGRPRRELRDSVRRRRPVRLRTGRRGGLRARGRAPAAAVVANFPGVSASLADVAASIEAVAADPAVRISWREVALPFPAELEARALEQTLGPLPRPSLEEGIRETMERFRAAG